jgi:F0F1-type ATP synthase assembly protein I
VGRLARLTLPIRGGGVSACLDPGVGRGDRITAANPWAFVGLGFEIAVPIVICTYLGYKADAWLGSGPWLLVVGALLGMSVAFYNLFRRVSDAGQDSRGGRS